MKKRDIDQHAKQIVLDSIDTTIPQEAIDNLGNNDWLLNINKIKTK